MYGCHCPGRHADDCAGHDPREAADAVSDYLDAIEARAEAATEGPWLNVGLVVWSTTTHEDVADTVVEPVNPQQLANADFIAHARTDVPALVAALRAVLDLTEDVGNESTGPSFVACYEVRSAINTAIGDDA